MIFRYGVDLPFADEWEVAPFLVKKAQGTLTFSDLFAQINEYRQFFPNLIFVYLGWFSRWDVGYEMLLSFLLACLVSYNVYVLGGATLPRDGLSRAAAFFLSSVLIFSPVQYENWLMGQQLIFFIPIACVTTCLLIAYSGLSDVKKFALCMCLSAVSTFSSANGILSWAAVLPALVWLRPSGASARVRRLLTAVWFVGFALSAGLYFHGYERPQYLPAPSEPLVKPGQAVAYFLAFLGAPLTGHSTYLTPLAALVGLALVALYAWAWWFFLKSSSDPALKRRLAGWLMIGAYSVGTAVLVTFGRLGHGVHQSMSSRYTTFSLYLIVSLVHLTAIIREADGGRPTNGRRLTARLVPTAIAVMIALHLLASAVAIRQTNQLRTRLLQAKACLLFINLYEGDCTTQDLIANPRLLRERANAVDALGFLRPALIKSRRVQEIAAGAEPDPRYGAFERLAAGDESGVASGRAVLPHRGDDPADAVLLAYETGDGGPVMFAVAEMDYKGDILKHILNRGDIYTWRRTFPLDELPPTAIELSAWAFDADSGKAFRIEGAHRVEKTYSAGPQHTQR